MEEQEKNLLRYILTGNYMLLIVHILSEFNGEIGKNALYQTSGYGSMVVRDKKKFTRDLHNLIDSKLVEEKDDSFKLLEAPNEAIEVGKMIYSRMPDF